MHVKFFPAQRARLLIGTLLILACGLITPVALAAPDLKWDLSYRSALRENPIASNEFMTIWPSRYPKRLIHDRLENYAGEAIEASLLIEQPDGDSGHPFATWFIKTRTTAQVCTLYKRADEPCKQLDPVRAEALIYEVMNFKPLDFTPSDENKIGDLGGKPVLVNYSGFISVYINGRVLQRPIAIIERERLSNALAKAQLTPDELTKREAEIARQRRSLAFIEAVRNGDIESMRSFIGQGQQIEDARNYDSPAIAIAAGAGQQAAVSFLLQRGARIDATESAALKAAVTARDVEMVEYLLARGALIDPPKNSLGTDRKVFATPLGVAVRGKDLKMAQLLLQRGANPNAEQSLPPFVSAALAQDFPMMDLLIANRADPDQSGNYDDDTALMRLMQRSGKLGGWPKDKEEQKAILKTEAELEKVVRKLVSFGANVNYINRQCQDAYYQAKRYSSQGMMRLLQELGADPERRTRCRENLKAINDHNYRDVESNAREEIARKTMSYLAAEDYAGLEALYKKLNRETERTPSGVWKLAVFAAQLKNFTQRTTSQQYWDSMDARIARWEKKYPKSVLASIFHAYALRGRALAHRGDGPGSSVSQENIDAMHAYAKKAYIVLLHFDREAARHPEWCRAVLEVIPYNGRLVNLIDTKARIYMRLHPYYHELYFTAAVYLEPRWGGSFAEIDALAKSAAAATSAKEGRALYSRIYWYLDQFYYSDGRSPLSNSTLFTKTGVNWTEMRAGFDDLVARYPDPWNLNAYAYFACRAQDFGTMNRILKKIGGRLLYSAWAGGATVEECLRHQDGDGAAMP